MSTTVVQSNSHQFHTLFRSPAETKVGIPSVEAICPSWPLGQHADLELIREDFTSWVSFWFEDERLRKKLHDLDAPLFAAMAYPRTGRRELLTLAKFIAWYFPWDDAIDDGSLYYRPEQIIRYRNETIALVKQSLGVDHSPQVAPHRNPAIQSFWDLGVEIRSQGTLQSNQHLISEQCAFIESSAQSQIERELTEPVSVEQYLKRRETNIAIYPLLALIYYAYKLEIPRKWSHHENKHMKIMWKELARMGTMGNDMLSLRREVMHGQFESLVPLLMYHHRLGVQAAMDLAVKMVHESYNRFNAAEEELYKEVAAENLATVKAYVQGCKDLIVCNLHWSYGLKRYMEKDMLQPDGSVILPVALSNEGY